MSQTAIKDELHAIVESLDESDLSIALRLLRGMSSGVNEDVDAGDVGLHRQTPRTDANELQHPWFDFIGIVDDDGPTDASENHDRYLAAAYMDTHDE